MTLTQLSPAHLAMLRDGSAITDDVIAARGYRTITDAHELKALGFAPSQRRAPGLLLPLWTTAGTNGVYVYRPDDPRVRIHTNRQTGARSEKFVKYEYPAGEPVRVDCPPTCRAMLAEASVALWITEGQKKADALASKGACALALLGVWNFKQDGVALLPDFDDVALKGRAVRIVFDSDVMTKSNVRAALDRLTMRLQQRGATVDAVYLPKHDSSKTGIDDYLAAGHTLAEVEALIESPRPQPKAAPAQFELVEDEQPSVARPLVLVNRRAYAAAWPQFKRTVTEIVGKGGEIVRLAEPQIELERHLIVMRDDGCTA